MEFLRCHVYKYLKKFNKIYINILICDFMYLCLCQHIVFDTLLYLMFMGIDFDKLVLIRLQKIPTGATVRIDTIAKKDPSGFVAAVKRLICSGWSEYEFTNDYSAIRRLDLPNYARDYFKTLRDEYTKKTSTIPTDGSGTLEQSINRSLSGNSAA